MIPKSKVLKYFGSVAKVAEFFGIDRQAVYQWNKTIPPRRSYELILKLPHVFGDKSADRHA